MVRQWWDHPVTIETAKPGKYVTIHNTERAAEFLLGEWPADPKGDAYHAAAVALVEAHEGRATIDETRRAFVAAAREAGIFVYQE